MLLAREFMRLAVLEALRPSVLLGVDSVEWPTIAGTRVFDSMIPPLDNLIGSEERAPIVAVYTEDGSLTKNAQSAPFYSAAVDLVFELSVVSQMSENDETFVGYLDTDAGVEAALGSFEDQIFHALHYGPTGKLWRDLVKLPFIEWRSETKRAGEESARLAKRTVHARIAIKEACYVGSPAAPAAGFDRLPSLLRKTAQALHESTYLHELALGMAAVAPQMPVRTLLETVGLAVAPRPSAVTGTAPIIGAADHLQGDT